MSSLNRAFSSPHVVNSSLSQSVSNSGYHFEVLMVSCFIEIALFFFSHSKISNLKIMREKSWRD